MAQEVGKTDLTQLAVTETMHERKKIMFMNADVVVVVLPGATGSLDERFKALTWRQLGLHNKSVLVLKTAGYWTQLLALINHVIAQGFVDAELAGFLTVVAPPEPAIDALRAAME
ncbi:MAG: hypothetical protein ACI92Z_002534 [Paracoccaceae bacterium]|jgi:uncharacterized protein (TIGR00730 family)